MKIRIISKLTKRILLLITIIFITQQIYSQQNRAGEIIYEHIEGYSYRIRLVVYTDTGVPAGSPLIEIQFGDGTSAMVARTYEVYLPNNYKQNNYQIEHKYSGPGTYIISFEDPGRNSGIRNIPNSVNTTFSLKTILQINPNLGKNSSPYFENLPFGQALAGLVYTYNSNTTDPDGDSLSYKLTKCLGDNIQPIDSYSYPEASISLNVDPVNGNIIWKNPVSLGLYNIAIEIEEWRAGVKIGSIIRDMQFEIVDKLTEIADISESNIKLFPNPTKGIVRFDFAGSEIEYIKVMNLNGKLILKKTSIQQNEIINISNSPAGMYFILIQTDRKMLITKLIKK
ncbi:MAG: hypothetical protein DRJ10_06085 [Bacteroidetes bacterium]|nr:MAG: hypothetical protein DRJ10_06085 [Bacteroidota bacterium]